jgi:hypothetical protein
MENIKIERIKKPSDPSVQKVIVEPESKAWMLCVTADGPCLMVAVKVEVADGVFDEGLLDVRDIPEGMTVKEAMDSVFPKTDADDEVADDDVLNVHGIPTRVGDMSAPDSVYGNDVRYIKL